MTLFDLYPKILDTAAFVKLESLDMQIRDPENTFHLFREVLDRYVYRKNIAPILYDGKVDLGISTVAAHYDSGGTRAIGIFCDMAQAGTLDKVRKCPECGKWFMQRRTDQLRCSDRCSQKKYRSAADFKKAMAEKKRAFRDRERVEKICRITASIVEWKSKKRRVGWQEYVIRQNPDITSNFIARKLTTGEIQAPPALV